MVRWRGRRSGIAGAYAILSEAVAIDVADGRRAHSPAMEWWRTHLLAEREALYEWIVTLTGDGACVLPPREGSKGWPTRFMPTESWTCRWGMRCRLGWTFDRSGRPGLEHQRPPAARRRQWRLDT